MSSPAIANQAAAVAVLGRPVFPCLPDKRPATPRGFKDATADPVAARKLFLAHPDACLIGMPTGTPSGISVVDLDPPNGILWFHQKVRRIPETHIAQTPRGGYHLYFLHQPGLRNSASKIWPGVDIRADGGYVIIPPSKDYKAINEVEPVQFPKWLYRMLNKPPKKHETTTDDDPSRPIGTAGLARFVARASHGERNQKLYWAACRLAERGLGNEARILLLAAGRAAGLDDREIHATINSALRGEKHG